MPLRGLNSIREVLLARATDEDPQQHLWAAIDGAGREFKLRGAYVSKAIPQEASDYVLGDELECAALQRQFRERRIPP